MKFRVSLQRFGVVLGLGASLVLSGCGSGLLGTSGPLAGPELTGSLHGGQQPIAGSSVSMYAAGTSGYGTGAVSLLNGIGSVMTDANGAFSLSIGYTCPTPDSQIYLVARGGNTGAGINDKSVLMAALGSCGAIGNSTFINMNEVSSIAAVYALAQFMTPGSTAVGTSSTNLTGLANAFLTAANLVDIASGTARARTPAGNGMVPSSTIHSLSNIMAACVNTTGVGGLCSSLFAAATPPGGTAPADTLSAMLNIVLNPGNNVTQLFNIPPPQGLFQPSLSGAPNDWTLSIEYTGGGLNAPQLPAVDASGNIWVPNAIDPGTLSEFSPIGVPLSGSNGFSGGGLSYPQSIAVDNTGSVWSANEGNASVSKHTSGGTPLSGSGYTATGLAFPYAIALDRSGNVFTANGNNSITKLNSSGAPLAQFVNGGLDIPYGVAVDASQNIWTSNSGYSNTVSKFNAAGSPASITGFSGGGLSTPVWIAIDAAANAWVANFNNSSVSKLNSAGTPLSGPGYPTPNPVSALAIDGSNTVWTANADGSISHLSNAGAPLSPATGYITVDSTANVGIVVDASGNLWTTDNFLNSLFEYVGAASPAVVPLQQAVITNKIGKRP